MYIPSLCMMNRRLERPHGASPSRGTDVIAMNINGLFSCQNHSMGEMIYDMTIISPYNQREMIAYQGLIAFSISVPKTCLELARAVHWQHEHYIYTQLLNIIYKKVIYIV